VCPEECKLICDPGRNSDNVRVESDYVLPLCLTEAFICRGVRRPTDWSPDQVYARIFIHRRLDDGDRSIVGGIVDDDVLPIIECLRSDAGDGV
jgi:hypothetical protein